MHQTNPVSSYDKEMHLYEKIKSADYVTVYLRPKNVQPAPGLLLLVLTLNSNQGVITRTGGESCPSQQLGRRGLLISLQGKEILGILRPALPLPA